MSLPTSHENSGTAQAPLTRQWPLTGLSVAVLCGITLVFYHGLWLPGLVLIKRDAFRFFLPIKQYLIERLSAGDVPQWFPYEALGRPFIGTSHSGLFHPFTLLYFAFPVPDAYRVSTLLSCLLAALGAFALGRTLHFSRTAALVSAVAFPLSGYVVSLTEHLVYLYSICLLPFFCATLEKALTEARAWTVAPALLWATVFLNGDLQTGYYYGGVALLWTWARPPDPPRQAWLRLGFISGLTILLAGVQLGPAAAVYVNSDRAAAAAFHDQALFWSTHPLRLITAVAYPVREQADPVAVARFFFGSPRYGHWAESIYLGVPVIGLALVGAWHRRDLRVLTFLGILTLVLALGQFGGLYEIFYWLVPFWSAFRFPEKLLGIASFAAAMLAGAGLDVGRKGKGPLGAWFMAGTFCAAAWLGLGTKTLGAWAATFFEAPIPLSLEVTDSMAWAFLWSAIGAYGLWLVGLAHRKHRLPESLLLAAVVGIISLDLARANLAACHTGPAEAATFPPPLAQAIAAREGESAPGRFRLISISESTYVAPKRIRTLFGHDADLVERRQALYPEHNAVFHLESANDYLPATSAAFASLLGPSPVAEVAARFNVAYFIGSQSYLKAPRNARGSVAILPEYNLALFKNPTPAKPRAYLSRHPERSAVPADPVALRARPDFLNGEVDVVETADPTLPGPATEGETTFESYAPEEVRIHVTTPRPAVLILLDAYDKGWTATLENGSALSIMRANALARAVVVPEGIHSVTFRYETPFLKAGAAASMTGALICLTIVVRARRQTRRTQGFP